MHLFNDATSRSWKMKFVGVPRINRLLTIRTTARLAIAGLWLSASSTLFGAEILDGIQWESTGPISGIAGNVGFDTRVAAMAEDESGNLYVGGIFSWIGDIPSGWVAKWDGSSWSSLGSDFLKSSYHQVSSLVLHRGALYAAGGFRKSTGESIVGVVCWSGTEWTQVGDTLNAPSCLAVHDGKLYAGGYFTEISGVPANYIAVYDGSNWSAVGSGMDSTVNALISHAGLLYAGGRFTTAGGQSAHKLARWDGSNWSPLGSDLGPDTIAAVIEDLHIHDGKVTVGGTFTSAGGQETNGVASWNGSAWETYSGGPGNTVYSLTEWQGKLLAGGSFHTSNGGVGDSIAMWDGEAWQAVEAGFESDGGDYVFSLHEYDDQLWVGGLFNQDETNGSVGLVVNDGADWGPIKVSSGMTSYAPNGKVTEITKIGDMMTVGGDFTHVGGSAMGGIAQWDGAEWHPMGSALDGEVKVIHQAEGEIYIGGSFTIAGSTQVNGVAHWDGDDWAPLGGGLGPGPFGSVNALAMLDGKLFVGGSFFQPAGLNTRNAAVWDGSSWQPVGGGLNKPVHDIVVLNGEVYFGGEFDYAFSDTGAQIGVYRFAKWTGSSWVNGLHSGRVGAIFDMEVFDGAIYVGGQYFLDLPGKGRSNVLKWDGSEFSLVGDGFTRKVRSLAFVDGTLVSGDEGGWVSCWNGTVWTTNRFAYGEGTSSIDAIHSEGGHLWIGGRFTEFAGLVSPNLITGQFGQFPAIEIIENGTALYFDVPEGDYLIQRSLNGLDNWQALETLRAGANRGIRFIDIDALNHPSAFYRAEIVTDEN